MTTISNFSQPVPLLDPQPLSPPAAKTATTLMKLKADEKAEKLVEMVIERQLSCGREYLEDAIEDMENGQTPVFLTPSLKITSEKVLSDRMDQAYCGTITVFDQVVYYIGGSELKSIYKLDQKNSSERLVADTCTESPIEQLVLSKKLLVAKSAFEIAAYKMESLECIIHHKHEQLLRRVAVSPDGIAIAFADEEGVSLLTEKGVKKRFFRPGIIDLTFINTDRLRYSCEFRVFELDSTDEEHKVFDTTNFQKSLNISLIRKSEKDQQLLYYFTKNEIYAVRQSGRGEYMDRFSHGLNFEPRYASVVPTSGDELILFSSSIGRVQMISCDISHESCKLRTLISFDTVEQTLRKLQLNNVVSPSFASRDRLTAPLLGVTGVEEGGRVNVYMQNVYGDIFWSVNDERTVRQMASYYGNWLKNFDKMHSIVATGVVSLTNKEFMDLFNYEDEDDYYNLE